MTRLPFVTSPARDAGGGPGATLLAALDHALPAAGVLYRPGEAARPPGAAGPTQGLAAAVALDKLLACNRLGWADVLPPGHRLAKICGLLGSDFPAEHEAAYTHALRLILLARSTWSALVHLPPHMTTAPATADTPPLRVADTGPTPSAPEADWLTTVRRLKARMAWRSTEERLLLDALDGSLEAGNPIAPPDARRLRDMWWCAELNDPVAEETAA